MTNDSAKPIKQADSDRPKPIDIATRLRQTKANMIGTEDEAHYWDCHEAAAEIERLRTIMYRIVDEDCTVAIQNGTFCADDEPLFAITDTNEPRNGAVVGPDPDSRVWETHTPPMQTTPGQCSTPREGTSEPVAWMVTDPSGRIEACRESFAEAAQLATVFTATEDGDVVYKVFAAYRQPQQSLTDTERDAVIAAMELVGTQTIKATLRGLLERLK